MLTLALDTSTPTGSVAIVDGGGSILESRLPVQAVRSESVLPEINRLVADAGYRPSDIGRVVVGSGPGSFTGVRIAAALAKGICAALDAELFAYSSLAAIAGGADATGRVCAAIDARRGQVYAAGYHVILAGFEQLFEPVAEPLTETLARLTPSSAWTLAAAIPETLASAVRSAGVNLLPPPAGLPSARALLRLAERFPEHGRVTDAATWEPGYVRASSAEREAGV